MKDAVPFFMTNSVYAGAFTRRILEISGVLPHAVGSFYFFVTIVVGVELPAGLIPDTKSPYRALKIKKSKQARPCAGRPPSPRGEPRHGAFRL